jgi:hypothetical protein
MFIKLHVGGDIILVNFNLVRCYDLAIGGGSHVVFTENHSFRADESISEITELLKASLLA